MATPRRSDTRRDEIVATAARLFEERGYHNTTMDDIAEAMGIRKPTLYHYVEGKGQVLFWIHDRLITKFMIRIRDRLDRGLSPSECLHAVMEDIFETLDSEPGHLRVYFEHHREIPERYQAEARARRDEYFRIVRGLIEEGVKQGEFVVDDVDMATLALFGMCNWAYQWYRPGGRLAPHEIAAMFWRIYANGIQAKPALA
ncbi:MAG: TetR/AcrR family transcriptional regulator [Micromonosporaceae bacterium]